MEEVTHIADKRRGLGGGGIIEVEEVKLWRDLSIESAFQVFGRGGQWELVVDEN